MTDKTAARPSTTRRVQVVMLRGSENVWNLEVADDERIIGATHEGNTAWVYIEGPPFDA